MESIDSALAVTGSVQVTITSIQIILGLALLYRNWRSSALRARGKTLTVLIFIGSAMQTMQYASFIIPSVRNSGYVKAYYLPFSTPQVLAFTAIPYVIKAYVLFFKFEISMHIARKFEALKDERDTDYNWFVKNRRIITSRRFHMFVFAVGALLSFIPAFVYQQGDKRKEIILMVEVALILVAALYPAKKLSSKYDVWGIKAELVVMIALGSADFLIWIVSALIPRSLVTEILTTSMFWLLFTLVQITSISYPLFKADLFRRQINLNKSLQRSETLEISLTESRIITLKEKLVSPSKLNEYLSHPLRQEAFRQHMEREFAVENLNFFLEVERYQDTVQMYQESSADAAEVSKLAYQIYSEYIVEDAPYCVNISSVARQKAVRVFPFLKELLTKIQFDANSRKTSSVREESVDEAEKTRDVEVPPSVLSMFDVASKEVLKLMEADSFMRFKSSPQFQAAEKLVFEHERDSVRKEVARRDLNTKRIIKSVVLNKLDTYILKN